MKSNYVYHTAAHWLGLEEWAGKDSNNPHILEFFREAGALVAGAEAFVNINMYMAKVVS